MAAVSAIDLCSLAWGERSGYVCLAVRDPSLTKEDSGYWVDHVYRWPNDRSRVSQVLRKARESDKDVYWAPAVFNKRARSATHVAPTNMLWADLDEVNPKSLPAELKPTAAWQSSPGRYQAVWQLDRQLEPDVQQQLNQRLTYAIGADKGGWDLTQVLRTPGTHNHKYKEEPPVKLMWMNGHVLNPVKLLGELPEVENAAVDKTAIEQVPEQAKILKRYNLPPRAKQLIRARRAQKGTRSETLWELECLLAESGLTDEEIVGVAMPTVWNKFKGRHDELTRLTVEARKAIEHAAPDEEELEVLDEDEVLGPQTWGDFDREHQAVSWMVADVWGESEVGFISGHPKSYKSWLAIDLAVSVATGTRFLGVYQSKRHNVLLIQEEDPKPILQERLALVGGSKGLVDVSVGAGTFDMTYALPDNLFIISNQGFTINEDWLEMLEGWITERDIKLVILDPLMMMGESFDEFKAFEVMTKVLKPLKRLRAKTQCAVVVVHHHTKGSSQGGARDMYGSVALWAWEEAALHLSVTGMGKITAERFSKHALLPPINIELGDLSDDWAPSISKLGSSNLYDVLVSMESGATVDELIAYTSLGRDAIDRQLKSLEKEERIEKSGSRKDGPGRPKAVWRVKP